MTDKAQDARPHRYRADSRLSRFGAFKVRTTEARGLGPGHPAVVEGRTLFPKSVVAAEDSPRLLVSGRNNPKLGDHITKGERKGWPIYHLTLEERATCPRSCPVWRDCYGNAMHRARRHEAGPELEDVLVEELVDMAYDYPRGFLVRLHTLGDFYSREYVRLWAKALAVLPPLHVFGYTARRPADEDGIGADVLALTMLAWDRFAIRFSRDAPAAQGSIVVEEDPHLPDVVVCPAQSHQTTCCGTCGLCWADAAQDKTIAFLRHGMIKPGRPRKERAAA